MAEHFCHFDGLISLPRLNLTFFLGGRGGGGHFIFCKIILVVEWLSERGSVNVVSYFPFLSGESQRRSRKSRREKTLFPLLTQTSMMVHMPHFLPSAILLEVRIIS
jgi:hypothetical protein